MQLCSKLQSAVFYCLHTNDDKQRIANFQIFIWNYRDTKDVGTFVKNYSKDSKVFILI